MNYLRFSGFAGAGCLTVIISFILPIVISIWILSSIWTCSMENMEERGTTVGLEVGRFFGEIKEASSEFSEDAKEGMEEAEWLVL